MERVGDVPKCRITVKGERELKHPTVWFNIHHQDEINHQKVQFKYIEISKKLDLEMRNLRVAEERLVNEIIEIWKLKNPTQRVARYKILSASTLTESVERENQFVDTRRRKVIFRCLEINICLKCGQYDMLWIFHSHLSSKNARWFNTFFILLFFFSAFAHFDHKQNMTLCLLRRRRMKEEENLLALQTKGKLLNYVHKGGLSKKSQRVGSSWRMYDLPNFYKRKNPCALKFQGVMT